MSQGLQNSLNFIHRNWGYFHNLDPHEMGTDCQIDHLLIDFLGKMLQFCLKPHQLITIANFCAFCDQVEIFKLLIFILIYKWFRITAIMLNGADYSH